MFHTFEGTLFIRKGTVRFIVVKYFHFKSFLMTIGSVRFLLITISICVSSICRRYICRKSNFILYWKKSIILIFVNFWLPYRVANFAGYYAIDILLQKLKDLTFCKFADSICRIVLHLYHFLEFVYRMTVCFIYKHGIEKNDRSKTKFT